MQVYFKTLKLTNSLANLAWSLLNDSYRSSLCVHFPGHAIATACIYLAMRKSSLNMINFAWWTVFETSFETIENIAAEILFIQMKERLSLTQVKGLMEEFQSKSLFKKKLNNKIFL